MQVKQIESVYDLVDEDQYSRMVQERQDNDWIVDDGESVTHTHVLYTACCEFTRGRAIVPSISCLNLKKSLLAV